MSKSGGKHRTTFLPRCSNDAKEKRGLKPCVESANAKARHTLLNYSIGTPSLLVRRANLAPPPFVSDLRTLTPRRTKMSRDFLHRFVLLLNLLPKKYSGEMREN